MHVSERYAFVFACGSICESKAKKTRQDKLERRRTETAETWRGDPLSRLCALSSFCPKYNLFYTCKIACLLPFPHAYGNGDECEGGDVGPPAAVPPAA